jgi:glyoxylase-like metal-dependent hydrolase (beta-lactamase superfamily II)
MTTENTHGWLSLADGVLARRYAELDLTVGLVIGDGECLVVDTRGDAVQGAELAAAVRERTPHPWTVALTHAHFDHCFGTSAFGGCAVYAHRRCAADLAETGEWQRELWVAEYREQGREDVAGHIAEAPILAPTHLVDDHARLSVGGRTVELIHAGRGHTDHDLVVHVPDARVVFAGDLVEQGAPPAFEDSCPQDWPGTLDRILALAPETVVPGHGEPVPPGFVAAQRDEIALLAELGRAVRSGELSLAEAARRSPYPEKPTTEAIARLPLLGDLP